MGDFLTNYTKNFNFQVKPTGHFNNKILTNTSYTILFSSLCEVLFPIAHHLKKKKEGKAAKQMIFQAGQLDFFALYELFHFSDNHSLTVSCGFSGESILMPTPFTSTPSSARIRTYFVPSIIRVSRR